MRDILPFQHKQRVIPRGINFGVYTVQIIATRTPKAIVDSFCLELTAFDKIAYSGPLHLAAPVGKNDTTVFEFDVYVPPNDTAGLTCYLHGGDGTGIRTHFIQPYWITTGDTATIFEADPRSLPAAFFVQQLSQISGNVITSRKRLWTKLEPSICDGYHDTLGNSIPKDNWQQLVYELMGWPRNETFASSSQHIWKDSLGNPLTEQEWEIQHRLYLAKYTTYDITKDTNVIWIAKSSSEVVKPVWKPWYIKNNRSK